MKTLDEIGLQYRTDKSSPYHNYLNTYEKYFKKFRDKHTIELWELGIGDINSANREGESAFVWRDYFTNCPTIRIFDNDPVKVERFDYQHNGIYSHHLDQIDEQGFTDLVKKVGNPFIIIDDASHVQKYTIKSFEILFPLLQSGGLYCIEDTVTSYWESWGGIGDVFNDQSVEHDSIMTYMYRMCHCINLKRQETFNPPAKYFIPEWIKEIESIHFHHSQIIIKKK